MNFHSSGHYVRSQDSDITGFLISQDSDIRRSWIRSKKKKKKFFFLFSLLSQISSPEKVFLYSITIEKNMFYIERLARNDLRPVIFQLVLPPMSTFLVESVFLCALRPLSRAFHAAINCTINSFPYIGPFWLSYFVLFYYIYIHILQSIFSRNTAGAFYFLFLLWQKSHAKQSGPRGDKHIHVCYLSYSYISHKGRYN